MKNIITKIKNINKKSKIFLIIGFLILSISYPVYAQTIDNNHRFQNFSWIWNPDKPTNERLEDLGNIYKDKLTGLKWDKNPSRSGFTWENAKSYCTSKGAGWRMPTIYELRTLISLNTKNSNDAYSFHPSIAFNGYWSSTTFARNTSTAWYFNLYNGAMSYHTKADRHLVLCLQE